MTREELDTLWNRSVNESIKAGDSYARYRYAEYVAAAERERMTVNSIHSCSPECDRPGCVAVRKAVEAEREACAKVCETGVDTEHPIVKGHIMRNFWKSNFLAQAIRARGSK
jgi:hypothetical protein